jgi:sulfide:quinone oxidoreductase
MDKKTFKILMVRGGSGGISLAARLVREGFRRQIGLLDRSKFHYSQPRWTLVDAGKVYKSSSERSEASVILFQVEWTKNCVRKFRPNSNQLQTAKSEVIELENIIVETEHEFNFDKINGAEGNPWKSSLISIYQYDQLESATKKIRKFRGGVAIFTLPPVPIGYAGAPQKVMYLTDEIWRQSVVREKSKNAFTRAGAVVIENKEIAAPLSEVVRRKWTQTIFNRKTVAVRPADNITVFKSIKADPSQLARTPEELHNDLLHVASPRSAHLFGRESLLASEGEGKKCWLNFDKHSLQHKKYPNFFGIRDVTGIPNSKTEATIRKLAPVVARKGVRFLNNEKMDPTFDGLSSCPLVPRIFRVMLAMFGYEGKLLSSFPLNPTKERRNYWVPKKDLLPPIYWHGILEGCI